MWGMLQEAQAEREAGLERQKAALEQETQRLASHREQIAQQSAQVGTIKPIPLFPYELRLRSGQPLQAELFLPSARSFWS